MLVLGEGSEAIEPYNKYDKIRPHSIRSLQFDQKVRPLSFRPEKFDLFTATPLDPSLGHIKKKAQNVFAWLDWVCNDLMPFSFVDLPRTRKYSNLNPICRNTLMKYLNLVTLEVENAIKDQLPDKFVIAFDGWTTGSTHYVGIMATVPKESSYETMLLAFTPLIDETCLNSTEQCRLIEETLELYGKDLDNVVAFICDNRELNKRFGLCC